jgi:hypothetical protein
MSANTAASTGKPAGLVRHTRPLLFFDTTSSGSKQPGTGT